MPDGSGMMTEVSPDRTGTFFFLPFSKMPGSWVISSMTVLMEYAGMPAFVLLTFVPHVQYMNMSLTESRLFAPAAPQTFVMPGVLPIPSTHVMPASFAFLVSFSCFNVPSKKPPRSV